ncbi:hypothetical protein [Priestia megaterium]|uniref:hypothetical protein n=1 Tax=Priestia megaterium TaxID=1404 RepID=UPI002E1BBB5A|nr:hypothetical protein [Priestia megaterium]
MKKLIGVLGVAIISAGLFAPAASAQIEKVSTTRTAYDKTYGVKSTITIEYEINDTGKGEYYKLTKVTGSIKPESLMTITHADVEIGQNGSYSGKPFAGQYKTYDISKTLKYTYYPDKQLKWKPVILSPIGIVGANIHADIKRGKSKWSMDHTNSVRY